MRAITVSSWLWIILDPMQFVFGVRVDPFGHVSLCIGPLIVLIKRVKRESDHISQAGKLVTEVKRCSCKPPQSACNQCRPNFFDEITEGRKK